MLNDMLYDLIQVIPWPLAVIAGAFAGGSLKLAFTHPMRLVYLAVLLPMILLGLRRNKYVRRVEAYLRTKTDAEKQRKPEGETWREFFLYSAAVAAMFIAAVNVL